MSCMPVPATETKTNTYEYMMEILLRLSPRNKDESPLSNVK